MSDTRIREPYPYLASCLVLVLGSVVVAGIEAGKVCRRLVVRLKEARS